MEFETFEQLMAAIDNDVVVVIEDVGEQILDIVVENVWEEVYYNYLYPRRYNRLGEHGGFVGSWKYSPPMYNVAGNWETMVFSDGDEMIRDGNHHGNRKGTDRREYMDQVIADPDKGDWDYNPGKGQYPYWKFPRDYWSPAIEQINSRRTIDKSVKKVFKQRNIQFVSI